MKLLRGIVVGVVALGVIVCLSSVSFAEEGHHAWKEGKGNEAAKIKIVKDSAVILQASNPDLATGLSAWAAAEEKEMQEWKAKKAKEEATEKLLRDSAAALQKSNPDLAKELWDMSEHNFMEKMKCPMRGKGHNKEREDREKSGE